jgi:predicted nucleic acid-binding Zn ribbon protein
MDDRLRSDRHLRHSSTRSPTLISHYRAPNICQNFTNSPKIRHLTGISQFLYPQIMSLTPISTIVFQIQNQPEWADIRDWGLIVQAWATTMSPAIASHSRPKSIARGIVTIATNSSSLAHQLTFGRQALCQQLNTQLIVPIAGLRFVSVGYPNQNSLTMVENGCLPIDGGDIVICSHCHCRARQGELLRWDMCRFCAIDLGILGGRGTTKL